MNDPIDASPSPAVLARHRTMIRRSVRRHFSRIGIAGMLVLGVATLLRPGSDGLSAERRLDPDATALPISELAVALAYPGVVSPGPRIAYPDYQPLWRPAGEVLKRGKRSSRQTATSDPNKAVFAFAPDPRARAQRETLGRWHDILTYSSRYRIKTDLARRIYDAALQAGIEPELGFRLVRVESVFNARAVSPAGALGLTQLMLGTARMFEPNVTREQLLEPDINLRIGFRYLRGLIREYKGDLKVALLVYNRGPAAVHAALASGISPANGYESIITRGYRGRGTLD